MDMDIVTAYMLNTAAALRHHGLRADDDEAGVYDGEEYARGQISLTRPTGKRVLLDWDEATGWSAADLTTRPDRGEEAQGDYPLDLHEIAAAPHDVARATHAWISNVEGRHTVRGPAQRDVEADDHDPAAIDRMIAPHSHVPSTTVPDECRTGCPACQVEAP